MAKKLVRYLLEGNGSVPAFVEDGGYWSVGDELVGRSVDEAKRFLPATVVRMTKADLIARVTAIGPKDLEGNSLDSNQIAALVDSFLAQIDMADLA